MHSVKKLSHEVHLVNPSSVYLVKCICLRVHLTNMSWEIDADTEIKYVMPLLTIEMFLFEYHRAVRPVRRLSTL